MSSSPRQSTAAPTNPRLALSIDQAAEALGISRDSFERHVMANVSLLRVGRRLLVPARELERWIEREQSIPLVAELSRVKRRTSSSGGGRGR